MDLVYLIGQYLATPALLDAFAVPASKAWAWWARAGKQLAASGGPGCRLSKLISLRMQYSIIAKVKAAAAQPPARAQVGCAAPDLHVTVADPSAFGLFAGRLAGEEPVAHLQTPRMLAFAARIAERLTKAGRFQARPPAVPSRTA